MMIYTTERTEDRRELDAFVREVYDRVSTAGDRMPREHYTMFIRGGANALHRFGLIVVPMVRPELSSEPHVIEVQPV